MQQVDPEEHLVHAAADQNVEARQQARQVQVQPAFVRYLEMCGENAGRRDDKAAIASQCRKKKMPRR